MSIQTSPFKKKRGRPRKNPITAEALKEVTERDYNSEGKERIVVSEEEKKKLAKYKPSYCEMVKTFFRCEEGGSWHGGAVPTMEKFGTSLGKNAVSINTLNLWREHIPEFNEACELAESDIRSILMDMGASKQYNSEFIKFLLGSLHNFSAVERRKVAEDKSDSAFTVDIHVQE